MKRRNPEKPASAALSPGPAGKIATGNKATRSAGEPTERTPGTGKRPKEIGGPDGPEPTRYGDWERNGRCSDF